MNEKEERKNADDLRPEYMFQEDAGAYLNTTGRKIAMYRKHGLLKSCKFGHNYVYRRAWLDAFAEEWSGYDLSNEEKVIQAISAKSWRRKHS